MIVADKIKTYELIDALLSIDTERNLSEERMAEVVRLLLKDWILLEKILLADGCQLPLRKWDSAADLTRERLSDKNIHWWMRMLKPKWGQFWSPEETKR